MCLPTPWGFSTSLYSNFRCVSLIANSTIPNFSHLLTSSRSEQLGKDSVTPMERAVSALFHDGCNSNAVLEIGNYLNNNTNVLQAERDAWFWTLKLCCR